MRGIGFLLAVGLIGALVPGRAEAFTEMIRHGYANCTSCHVSPTGGGALTEYGRSLSADLMSTWSKEHESDFAYSVVKLPDWLAMGGDVRGVSIYRNTPQVKSGRFLFMQADLEAAATYKQVTVDASFGTYTGPVQARRYYVNYRPSDELSFRAGHFTQAFGLMDPEHTSATHRGVGFDEGGETFNLEAAWLGEHFTGYLTANLGDADDPARPDPEKGVSVRPAFSFADRYQVGMSYYYGTASGNKRHLVGPFAVLGFTPHFFLLSELDYQSRVPDAGDTKNGVATYNRLGYEPMQGLIFYLSQNLLKADFADANSFYNQYGIGTQFFPRPHFEFNLLWYRQVTPGFPDDLSDYMTLQLHWYI